jgi:hypothetical protein
MLVAIFEVRAAGLVRASSQALFDEISQWQEYFGEIPSIMLCEWASVYDIPGPLAVRDMLDWPFAVPKTVGSLADFNGDHYLVYYRLS